MTQATCPYLGLAHDRTSCFLYPETKHRCFAATQSTEIPLNYQSFVCLTQEYQACTRFVEPSIKQLPIPISSLLVLESKHQKSWVYSLQRLILWVLVGLLLLFSTTLYSASFFFQQSSAADLFTPVVVTPVATSTPTPTGTVYNPDEAITREKPTIAAKVVPVLPTSTPTPVPGGRIYTLSPAAADIGWVASGEDRGNHFKDSFLYAGIFKGQTYQSAFQFDLSPLPRGASIHYASIQLTGLRDDRLGQDGLWMLRILKPEIDKNWRGHNYQAIFNAPVLLTLNPILGSRDLMAGKTYTFELLAAQRNMLETRLLKDEHPKVSFRLDGPLVGPDNLFAWDTGYGPRSEENKVTLFLNVGPAPATPPPYDYIVVTSTPTPENVLTAAAIVLQITADATQIGTATPVPHNMATATPIPDSLVVVLTPTPGNTATAEVQQAMATAAALTTGTPTPIPTNASTATPVPTSTLTPTPTPPDYVLITSTPTADSIFAAATLSAAATAQAERIGTPTPLPDWWVTPVVVTSTPSPENTATAEYLQAVLLTTGTPTLLPSQKQTATPTPVFVIVQSPALLTAPTTPKPTPRPIPAVLLGKILFLTDREGATEEQRVSAERTEATPQVTPQPYVLDPATGQLGRLTDIWPYEAAVTRDAWSADLTYQTYTKQLLWTNVRDTEGNMVPTEELAIHYYDYRYKVEQIVTHMGAGITYDPAWSPVSDEIAFVSTESGNDEIWVINRDGTNVRQLTHNQWEWDKHPSWSPDGQQIVFFSNRSGNKQLWIMNKDGSEQRLLMDWNPYNDWDPVWVKYENPAPLLAPEPDWRFINHP